MKNININMDHLKEIPPELQTKHQEIITHQVTSMKRREFIKRLFKKRDMIGVEIGVFFGINAYFMLSTLYIKHLYLIDPFTDKEIGDAFNGAVGEDAEQITKEVLAPYKDKIEIIKGFSWDVVNLIPNELDFVYVDGDHREEAVSKDLNLYYPKIKVGGMFAGHDYVKEKPPRLMVKSTVDNFFEDKKETVVNAGRDWWVIIREK